MRKHVRDFVQLIGEYFPIAGPIYEFGSFQVRGQRKLADLRPLFPDREYVGCDLRPGPGVDRVMDMCKPELEPKSVGTVLCLDTLEHVEFPHFAMRQVSVLLKSLGIVVISSVMDYPIHDHPHDYWRFTPQAFHSILTPFDTKFVGYAGKKHFPHTVVGVGVKGLYTPDSGFEAKYEEWQRIHFNARAGKR